MNEAILNLTVASLVTGGGLMIRALSRRKKTQKITDTPRSKVATAPQGYVELQGFAWPAAEEARTAAGQEVVLYRLEVQRSETRGSGKNRRREWVTIFYHAHVEPFYLVDPTGLARVDPGTAELDVGATRTRKWSSLSASEKKWIEEVASRRPVPGFPPSRGLLGIFSSPYRVLEKEILLGAPLYLHGDFRTPSVETPKVKVSGLSEFTSRIFNAEARSTKNINHFLDKNRDGRVCADEARYGYGFAARQARNKSRSQPSQEREFEVCGHVGSSSEHRLLIADMHEEHLVKRRQKWLWLEFVAGAALLAAGCAVVSYELLRV